MSRVLSPFAFTLLAAVLLVVWGYIGAEIVKVIQ